MALDLVGSVIVFSSVLSCLIAFDNAGETLGLALNYSLQVPIYLAWVIKFMTDLEIKVSVKLMVIQDITVEEALE